MPEEQAAPQIDLRQYIGVIFFRWQIIAICFLYCLLAGVLFIQLAPKRFKIAAHVMLYRDPTLVISNPNERNPYWTSRSLHEYMLTNERLIKRVIGLLEDKFGGDFNNRQQMELPVKVEGNRQMSRLLTVSVTTGNRAYGVAFLKALLDEHMAEWRNLQRQARESAGTLLETELARLEHQIKSAEEDLLEYQRLHDIARVEARSTMESRYLEALMERRNQLSTEIMLLEAQFPRLRSESPIVIGDIDTLTRETGRVTSLASTTRSEGEAQDGDEDVSRLPPILTGHDLPMGDKAQELRNLSVRMARLEREEQRMADNLTPENPQLKALRKEVQEVRDAWDLAVQVAINKMQDRYKALTIQLEAIEAAEYKWQAKNLLAAQRKAEYNRIANVVSRYEANYGTLYSRLHEMRVSEELKAEQFNISEPPKADDEPVWPDPVKILLAALAAGLGSGFGLALLLHVVDNKIQSIRDVENELQVPFLGGVPYWVHSGLETTIRPIVTEEHSAGAVEAYRALRTSILAALEKNAEKILMVTSADSREGKTLTTLNLAIIIAQMNKRVLLVDMDLRRGRLHRSLGVDRVPGVSDALKQHESLRNYICGTRIEHLDMVPTGSNVDDAAELLQSNGIVNLFDEVQDDYDYILIDTSPILRVTDTSILAGQGVGCVLFVARVNHTPKPLVKYALNMMSEARVLGLVMNSIEMNKISSLYYTYQYPNYAYYSNAYAYGYNYYYYGDQDGRPTRRRHSHARLRGRFSGLGRWLREAFLPID